MAMTVPSKSGKRAGGARLTSVLILMTLVAAGCADSGETELFSATTHAAAAEAGLIEDITAGLAAEFPIPAGQDRFRCVAEAAVAAVGVDRLIAAGAPAPGTFDGTLLDAAGQAALIEAADACIDIGSVLGDAGRVGVALPPEAAVCIADGVERAGLFEAVARAAAASGPDQAIADNIVPIIETLSDCLTIPEVADLVDALGLSSFLPGS